MRRVLFIVLFAMMPVTGSTQSATDRDAVLKVVQIFFDTMTARDADGATKILLADARFYALDTRKPKSEPTSFTGEDYFARLRKQTQTHRERIWNPEVRVHQSIATLWAPYDFWTDGKFSHCGVDAFDFVKTSDGWKISGGAFTMETKCEPSPLGPLPQ